MKFKVFTIYMGGNNDVAVENVNTFTDRVKVEKMACQYVPDNGGDYWSVLIFYTDKDPGERIRADQADQVTGQVEAEEYPGRPEGFAERLQTNMLTEEDLLGEEIHRYHALRLWRKDRAEEANLPEFMVMHDSTLMQVAMLKPTSIDALKELKGWHPAKTNKYGHDVVAIMNAF